MAAENRVSPRAKNMDKNGKKRFKSNKAKFDGNPRVLLVAQELRFAKNLAGNEKKQRDKSLKHLKQWLRARSSSAYGFSESDLMKIWKGLFYSMWMSDKPLIQEELCESISSLFGCFEDNAKLSVQFFKCFMKTMATGWFGLDHHRMDKFLMFIRRMIRGLFRSLHHHNWDKEACECLSTVLSDEDGIFHPNPPVYARNSLGLMLHVTDVWNEELAKISEGDIPSECMLEILKPFAHYLARGSEKRLCSSISKNIFTYLLKQSDIGIEYEDKADAWRKVGCPHGGVDAMVEVESDDEGQDQTMENGIDSEDDSAEANKRPTALDPRAGRVDVVLPQLNFDAGNVAALLQSLTADKMSTLINRTKLKKCAENFESLSRGRYPLTVNEFDLPSDPAFQLPSYKTSAVELIAFDKKAVNEADELNLKGLSRKRKRKLFEEAKMKTMTGVPIQNGELGNGEDDDINFHTPRKLSKKSPGKKSKKINEWIVEEVKTTKPVETVKQKNIKQKRTDEQTNDSGEKTVEKQKHANADQLKKKRNRKRKKLESADEAKENVNTPVKAKTPRKDGAIAKLKENTQKVKPDANGDSSTPKMKSALKSSDLISPKAQKLKTPEKIRVSSTPKKKNVLKSNDLISPKAQKQKSPEKIRDSSTPNKKNVLKSNDLISPKAQKQKSPEKIRDSLTPKKKASPAASPKSPVNENLSEKSLNKGVTQSPRLKVQNLKCNENPAPKPKKIQLLKNSTKSLSKSIDMSDLTSLKHLVRSARRKTLDSKLNIADSAKKTTPKRVNFVLKNNSSAGTLDYLKSVKKSPSIPYDSAKKPSKTLLKPHCTPSPVNPFFKKKLRLSF